ncbi:MAG: Uma2 family endonuclease [Tunicatimonas sp.]
MNTATKHRFTVDDVYLMVDHGILPPDQRIELINGEIIDMSPINPPHASSVTKLDRFFSRQLLQDEYIVRVQNPVLLSDHSLPEADLAIAHYREALLEDEHPQASDIAILIEVADTTYRSDRNTKAPLYAAEGVPVYWIVNLNKQQVEVYTHPKEGEYTQVQIHQNAFEVLGFTITPRDIFPKK